MTKKKNRKDGNNSMEGLDLYEGVVKHVLYRLSGILVIDQNHLGVDLLSSRQTRAKKEKAITENVIGCRIGKKTTKKQQLDRSQETHHPGPSPPDSDDCVAPKLAPLTASI
jgi:hypothetical protein